jgi:hypothetical protein
LSCRINVEIQADEPQFEEPLNTEGFYNRPPGAGRYPVRVETYRQPYRVDPNAVYNIKTSVLIIIFSTSSDRRLNCCKIL